MGSLTILLGGLARLSRIVKFGHTGFSHTIVSTQSTPLCLDWQGLKTRVYPINCVVVMAGLEPATDTLWGCWTTIVLHYHCLVLMARIELATSSLPRKYTTAVLHQQVFLGCPTGIDPVPPVSQTSMQATTLWTPLIWSILRDLNSRPYGS